MHGDQSVSQGRISALELPSDHTTYNFLIHLSCPDIPGLLLEEIPAMIT
jgi:hypothetical protein